MNLLSSLPDLIALILTVTNSGIPPLKFINILRHSGVFLLLGVGVFFG